MTCHPQMKRLQALQEQPGVEWTHGCAHISKPQNTRPENKGQISECFHESQSMISRLRLHEAGKSTGCCPVEVARIDDQPPNGSAVPTDKLGGRVNDYRSTEFKWPQQVGGRNGVVNHQRNAVPPADFGDGFQVDDFELGIAEGFDKECLGLACDRFLPTAQVIGCNVFDLDAEVLKGVRKQAHRAAVQVRGGNDFVARFGQGEKRQGFGCLPKVPGAA